MSEVPETVQAELRWMYQEAQRRRPLGGPTESTCQLARETVADLEQMMEGWDRVSLMDELLGALKP